MLEILKSDKKTINKIYLKFNKCINDYGLINDGDHILIGLSGGKDSMALVELLGKKMKIHVPKFKLSAVHISVENIPYNSDIEYLKDYSESFSIPFYHRTTKFEELESQSDSKSKCFLCSWHRRKELFRVASELKCNKIALGHHLDDMVETMFMNLIYQGSFSTMPPKLNMDKFEMTVIRPLGLILESEMIEMERIRLYKKQIKNCPFEKDSSRSEIKDLIKQLEKWNPAVRQSAWAAMENIKFDYLPKKKNL